jgi:protein-tyrosine phosphatase
VASPVEPPLRVDWLDATALRDDRPGRLGLTFLPGKRGASLRYPGRVYRRDVEADLTRLAAEPVHALLLLVEDAELERWGDPDIVERAAGHGLRLWRHAIADGGAPASLEAADKLVDWIDQEREAGNVAVACMGGVGRTGLVVACALVRAGWDPADAIREVRRVRHPTAVETPVQEAFVLSYGARSAVDRNPGSARVAP